MTLTFLPSSASTQISYAVKFNMPDKVHRLPLAASLSILHIDSANEEISVLKEIERPVDRAINLGKILCPNNHCTDNKEFFLTCSCCESVIVTHSGT